MKNSFSQGLVILILLLAITSIISNVVVFINMRAQQRVIQDFNNFEPTIELKDALSYDFSYPSINAFTVPFKTYLGRVYLRDSHYSEAIKYFHDARKYNPYLKINENYLAEVYDILEVKDSFDFYSTIAYKEMPNNPIHFGRYIKSIGPHNDTYIIDSLFNQQKFKYNIFWQLYLSSIVGIESKSDLAYINFDRAIETFQNDEEIERLVDYNIYGQNEVKKAREVSAVADKYAINGDFKNAIILLEKALKIHPHNDYYEKIATIYFKQKNFEKSLFYIEKFELKRSYNKPRYNLIKGINLCELNQKEKGCDFLTNALILKDPQAKKAKQVYCN